MRPTLALLAALLAAPDASAAFTVDRGAFVCEPGPGSCSAGARPIDIEATLTRAPRWSGRPFRGRGWHDGIQVSVEPGFDEAFASVLGVETGAVRDRLRAAFHTWETPELRFDVRFDAPDGSEIDLFAVDGSHPNFGGQFGPGTVPTNRSHDGLRLLTNGTTLPGLSFTDADIFLAVDQFAFFANLLVGLGAGEPSDGITYLQRTFTHYIGHAIGFDHPDNFPFASFDSDADPLTPVDVDPGNPFAALLVNPNIDEDAMMVSEHLNPFAYFLTDLRPDDRAGLDVLYPSVVPEPGSALLLASGLAGLARRGGRGAKSSAWSR